MPERLTDAPTAPEISVELFADSDAADEVIGVMHAAFAEYAQTGLASSAMLETPESLREEMTGRTRIALVRVNGAPAASAKHHITDDGHIYFGRLGVAPAFRGIGLASRLVRALRAQAHADGLRGVTCMVRANEPGNIAVYEHLGMQVVERRDVTSLSGHVIDVVRMRDAESPRVRASESALV